MRFSNYLRSKATQMTSAAPFRLSPGQYSLLCAEAGNPRVQHFATPLGIHDVQVIHCTTRATGDNVILCPREDLFIESESPEGVRLVSVANEVTSVPDNIAAVEVVSVGELVQGGFLPGEIVFIDFFRVKQGYIVENDELYIAGGDAFAAKFDAAAGEIVPLDNFVTTKRATDRMRTAVNGATAVQYSLDTRLAEGIVSGRTSTGDAATHTVYEEVVRVGKLTKRPRAGVMTKAERAALDVICRNIDLGDWAQYDGVDEDEAAIFNQLLDERRNGRVPDIAPGDLVVFCKEVATQLRVRGDFRSLLAYENVLGVIDDAAIERQALTRRRAEAAEAPRIVLAGA